VCLCVCVCVCVRVHAYVCPSYPNDSHMKLCAEEIGLEWVFLNDGQVGGLIPSES